MRDDKRAISQIITTIIMIVIVLGAVGIVWVIVQNILAGSSEDINVGAVKINLDVERVKMNGDGTITVNIKRNAGKADLVGLKIIVGDGEITQTFEETTSLEELSTEGFDLTYSGIVKTVEVAPILKSSSGKDQTFDVVEKYDSESIGLQDLEKYGLINWWRFEGNADDEFENNNGALVGNTNCDVQGKYGKSCEFDGTGDYISVAPLIDLADNTPWTISYWFYQDANTNDGSIGIRNSNNYAIYHHSANNGRIYVRTNANTYLPNTGDLSGEWRNLVIVCTGEESDNFYYYLDNEFQGKSSRSFSRMRINSFGFVWGNSNMDWDGKLDEIMIFDEALTSAEVKNLYDMKLS